MNRRRLWAVPWLCFWLAACQEDTIETYTVPKEARSLAMDPAASAKEMTWKIPEGWLEQAPSSMRVGSFLVKTAPNQEADISIIPLGGDAGGDLFNINRWRGQIDLPPLSAMDLSRQSQIIALGGHRMRLVDFAKGGKRIVAAIHPHRGRTWFFKMTGSDEAVRQVKPTFLQFLASVKFND